MQEIETKILEIDKAQICHRLDSLGAQKILDTKLTVDWFRPHGVKGDEDLWYLRIRTTADGTSEVTWKSKPEFIGISKQVREVGFLTQSPGAVAELLEAIGLEKYAHQEKFRTSWKYKEWRFDLDQYPNMPAYLEIEGNSEAHLKQAIELLQLQGHRAVAEGERTLIQREYGLDWHTMSF